MRVLFTAVPAFGHVVPMLPVLEAARADGHDVVLATSGSFADVLDDVPLLAVGPGAAELVAEATRRDGGVLAIGPGNRAGQVGLFTDTRVDLTWSDALAAARSFEPDLIVGDSYDYVAPLVASALSTPWAPHGITVEPPPDHVSAYDAALDRLLADRSLGPPPRVARVDPWPTWLQRDGHRTAPDSIAVRPESTAIADSGWVPTGFPGRPDLPVVLVTLGTIVDDRDLLEAVVSAVASLAVNVVVTTGLTLDPTTLQVVGDQVQAVSFAPITRLLEGVSAVVSVGGAGTVLASLTRGVPMVLLPILADQPLVAERVAALGAAVVVDSPGSVAAAVADVLDSPRHREAAEGAARRITRMPVPAVAWRELADRTAAYRAGTR